MKFPGKIFKYASVSFVTLLIISTMNSAFSQQFPPAPGDLVALHYDVSPDLDDLQAIAAGANLSEWFSITPAVVIGTYGHVGLGGNKDSDLKHLYEVETNTLGQGPNIGETRRAKGQRVADAAFGPNNYLDTGNGWPQAVNEQAESFWAVLSSGASVYIADGGPMDFTAEVLTRLQSFHGATSVQLKNVFVIQHSLGFNVQRTLVSNRQIVSNLATYITIANGNVGNNATADLADRETNTTTSAFAQWARHNNSHTDAWNEALNRFTTIVDFSDTVEYLHILNVPLAYISNLSTFAGYCDQYTCAVAPPPECNGKAVTVNLSRGQLPTDDDDVILGTSGNDTINSLGGNDTICALEGDDVITSGNGNDWIDAGPGNDIVDGGDNNDTIFGDSGSDTLNGGSGNDQIFGENDSDYISGNSGDDSLNGGAGIDQILGGTGNDTIDTGTGGNRYTHLLVNGGSGNDIITGSPDSDHIRGATGNDVIQGSLGNDALFGGGGNDEIKGQGGDDLIRGNGSKDTLSGGAGNDDIDGGTDADTIYGGADNDRINGSTGNDALYGGAGNDVISGGGGNDQIFGNRGNDSLIGGGSNDSLNGGSDVDACDGQSGIDLPISCETYIDATP
jgi:Ca2+-binding RTX toxin-like protein